MARCDSCEDDVQEVWRHAERSDSMTHREVRWLCRECNPEVHGEVERIPAGEARAESGPGRASD